MLCTNILMATALAFGCFDILHYGHLQYLKRAKALAGSDAKLIVVLATDATIRAVKKRDPVFDEQARLEMIKSLKLVDDALLGSQNPSEKYEVIRKLLPDVVVLGYDQPEAEEKLKAWLASSNIQTKVVRVTHAENAEVYKTSKAMEKLKEQITKSI